MKASVIDKEMYEYFTQLNEAEKSSIVEMIKTFLKGKHEETRISIEQYNAEIDESLAEIERGESYTHEEVVNMSKEWINGR